MTSPTLNSGKKGQTTFVSFCFTFLDFLQRNRACFSNSIHQMESATELHVYSLFAEPQYFKFSLFLVLFQFTLLDIVENGQNCSIAVVKKLCVLVATT